MDDVDAAATAMLVLKHGGYSFDVKAGNFFDTVYLCYSLLC